MRFSQNNTIKSRELQLAGASSATMSQSTAITIDAILFKKKNSSALTMESQATREHLSKLIYTVEFYVKNIIYLNPIAAFSLQSGGAKKEPKATLRSAALASPTPEKKRRGFVSRLARRDKGSAPLTAEPF